MKTSKGITKKPKTMDYTNYAYNEAVGRLKLLLAESYIVTPKTSSNFSYGRSINDDSTDNCSETISVIERPIFADISKYLSSGHKTLAHPSSSFRRRKLFDTNISPIYKNTSNLANVSSCQNTSISINAAAFNSTSVPTTTPADNRMSRKPQPLPASTDTVQTPVEIFKFIEKQEDYIEQLEKESKYCRGELSQLLGKVKEVITENEQLSEQAHSEFAAIGGNIDGGGGKNIKLTSPSSDSSEDTTLYFIPSKDKVDSSKRSALTQKQKKKRKDDQDMKPPRYANAPPIFYEARISELEAELIQTQIDLKRMQTENEELKRKLARVDPVIAITGGGGTTSHMHSHTNACETHRKEIEQLQQERNALEETVRHLQKLLDEAKENQCIGGGIQSKRCVHDLLQKERTQAELEIKHLRDELDRQHERVRELQHEMARRIAEERTNAERRYNNQVDQLGGDLSSQWELVSKLQLELERQKRHEADLKRDLSQRNTQIEELKMELRSNRSSFLGDMAQVNAERQSLEQEITALRLQLDRSAREAKTETTRLNAEINSLRQRLDRGDADLLHSKREVLRLNDEIANLEKELAYGELKNDIRPTKKDLDKRISEMQDRHAETVNELEDMIQSQKQLMDKLTSECKVLTNKLEEATLKNNQEKQYLRDINEKLMQRLRQIWASYKELNARSDPYTDEGLLKVSGTASVTSGDEELRVRRQEHFANDGASCSEKPLSTTTRPRLVHPSMPPSTTINHHLPSVSNHYYRNPLQAAPHCQEHPQQQQQQQLQAEQFLQSPIRTSTPQTVNPERHQLWKHEKQTTAVVASRTLTTVKTTATTTPAITTTSPLTVNTLLPIKKTMKISKTKWEWVRSSSKVTEPTVIPTTIAITTKTPITQSTTTPTTIAIMAKTTTTTSITTTATSEVTAAQQNSLRQKASMSSLEVNTITTTASMPTTVNNNTIQTASLTTTTITSKAVTMITPPPIMNSSSNTSNNSNLTTQPNREYHTTMRHCRQLMTTRHSTPTIHHHQCRHHQLQRRQQQQQQQQYKQQRCLLLALHSLQQQKADQNRKRALALWGRQIRVAEAVTQATDNSLCNNSLPRQQPKCSSVTVTRGSGEGIGMGVDEGIINKVFHGGTEEDELKNWVGFHQFEFDISSPSLMRSCDSDSATSCRSSNGSPTLIQSTTDRYEMSESSLSPVFTTRHRLANVDCVNTIECDKGGMK